MLKIRAMDPDDKRFFIMSILIPAGAWWLFVGRKKYSAKGLK